MLCFSQKEPDKIYYGSGYKSRWFLHSRVPRASITNSCLGLYTLESRRKLRDVCVVLKLLNGSSKSSTPKSFSVFPSVTRAGSIELSYAKPRYNLQASLFAGRAQGAFCKRENLPPRSPWCVHKDGKTCPVRVSGLEKV